LTDRIESTRDARGEDKRLGLDRHLTAPNLVWTGPDALDWHTDCKPVDATNGGNAEPRRFVAAICHVAPSRATFHRVQIFAEEALSAMKFSDQSHNLHIELDTKHCELTEAQIEQLEEAIDPLRAPAEPFPVSHLFITIEYAQPSNDYRVKTVLQLPGKSLATGDLSEEMYPAFRRCIRKLLHKLSAYKHRLGNEAELAKHTSGTRHEVIAARTVDPNALENAVADGNYAKFRTLLYPFEEPVRKRAGRWIQRYPKLESQLGQRFDLADVVEEVFLNAFERFGDHPREVPFGDWLEHMIDPSLKLLSSGTEEELANIRFVRTALEAQAEQRDD
jgi:ribosome-associated translation inhibitor RaiA